LLNQVFWLAKASLAGDGRRLLVAEHADLSRHGDTLLVKDIKTLKESQHTSVKEIKSGAALKALPNFR
jgi:hypothetical protein